MPTKEIDKLINWGELSRQLAGSRSVVSKNRMPKKHEDLVNQYRMILMDEDTDNQLKY